jgi:glutaredoxin
VQHLKVFVKQDCPNCPAAKNMADKFPETEVYDIEQAEGLAEAAYYSVQCTPSIIIVDDKGQEIRAWRCTVPSPKDIAACI